MSGAGNRGRVFSTIADIVVGLIGRTAKLAEIVSGRSSSCASVI
jgi:hypothetical protein